MWDKQKRERFQFLRQRELDGALTLAEQTELLQMVQEIEHVEAASLRPATERLHDERQEIETQNRALGALMQRKEAFVTRPHSLLNELETELLQGLRIH